LQPPTLGHRGLRHSAPPPCRPHRAVASPRLITILVQPAGTAACLHSADRTRSRPPAANCANAPAGPPSTRHRCTQPWSASGFSVDFRKTGHSSLQRLAEIARRLTRHASRAAAQPPVSQVHDVRLALSASTRKEHHKRSRRWRAGRTQAIQSGTGIAEQASHRGPRPRRQFVTACPGGWVGRTQHDVIRPPAGPHRHAAHASSRRAATREPGARQIRRGAAPAPFKRPRVFLATSGHHVKPTVRGSRGVPVDRASRSLRPRRSRPPSFWVGHSSGRSQAAAKFTETDARLQAAFASGLDVAAESASSAPDQILILGASDLSAILPMANFPQLRTKRAAERPPVARLVG